MKERIPSALALSSEADALAPSLRSAIDAFVVMDVMSEANRREAAGESIVHMEVGQPGTPAPRLVREAAKRAIDQGALGYTDAFRHLHPGQGGQFTFWDYFRMAFEHNRGIRIDHFLLSPQLSNRLESCEIDKGPRGQAKPSDHTPIVLQLR